MRILKRITGFLAFMAALILLGMAGSWTLGLAWADLLSNRDSIADRRRAAALAHNNVKYWIRLATLQQQYGETAIESYRQAIAASPLNAGAWMGLGLEYELKGDYRQAERSLLRAAEVSREFVPRWTLANYYYRRDNGDCYWPWARQALAIGSGDLIPLFRMAWALNGGDDPAAHHFLVDRRLVYSQYLLWLIAEKKVASANETAKHFATFAEIEDVPALLYFVNERLDEGAVEVAAAIWNGLVDRKLLDSSRIPTPQGLIDAAFAHEPLDQGFEWREGHYDGLTFRAESPGLRVAFSGRQPEECAPVAQFLLLAGGRGYQFAYSLESTDIPKDSGLSWRLISVPGGSEVLSEKLNISNDGAARGAVRFSAPSGVQGGRLMLLYRRSPGTTRITGWLRLNQVTIRPAG